MTAVKVCSQGHSLTENNLAPSGRCLTCKRAAALRYYHEGRRAPKGSKGRVAPTTIARVQMHGRTYQIGCASNVAAPPTRDTFERDYMPLRGLMLGLSRARIHLTADAEDVAQDAILHILMHVRLGRVDVNPEAHAVQAVRNSVRRWRAENLVRTPDGWSARFKGLPQEWDDCAVTAMQSLPRARKRSSKVTSTP